MITVTVVGTGSVVPRFVRRQCCVVIRSGSENLVFDLGSGAGRGMVRAGLDPFSVDRLLSTHFHPAHTEGVVPRKFPAPPVFPGGRPSCAPAEHRPESIAYRLEAENGAFVYTGDTGYIPCSSSAPSLTKGR